MQVASHPRVDTPPEERKIWRYTSLPKLVSILSSGALFFARADSFEDNAEGALPKATKQRRDKLLEGLDSKLSDEFIPSITRGFTQFTYINCWHLKESESATMWSSYSDSDPTICIESTVGRLRDAIDRSDSEEDDDVYIHKIQYVDYEEFDVHDWDPVNISDYLPPYLYKRLEFAGESELRAIVQRQPRAVVYQTPEGPEFYPGDKQKEMGVEPENPQGGLPVSVNPGILCARIHVSENAPEWKAEAVETVVNEFTSSEAYTLPVVHSNLHSADAVF